MRGVYVVIVAAAFAAWPASAAADITISGATIDGVTSTPVPPGSVLPAHLTGSATGGDKWKGTRYRFGTGASQCVDTDDVNGNNKTVNLNVTAPGTPGPYDAGFTATGENNCGGTQSAEKVLPSALRVMTPGANPNLPPRCGINVMLVLDKSGSIESSGQTENVREATRAFLNALSGTGASVSITDFSSTAKQQVGYTTVTARDDRGPVRVLPQERLQAERLHELASRVRRRQGGQRADPRRSRRLHDRRRPDRLHRRGGQGGDRVDGGRRERDASRRPRGRPS